MTLAQRLQTAFNLGSDAYFNGVPKTYQGGGADVRLYLAWHKGWLEAWTRDTEGQIKLGVYR